MKLLPVFLALSALLMWASVLLGADSPGQLRLRLSWGHRSAARPFYVKLLADNVQIAEAGGEGLEPREGFRDGAWQTRSGGGDVDGVRLALRYPRMPVKPIRDIHAIWADLIAQSDADTARRLRLDAAYRPDPRRLTVQMDRAGTRGFAVTVDQLLQHEAFWVPSLDVYVAAGESPRSFADHQRQLAAWGQKRILDQVRDEPEATYEQYKARWEDMGHPRYVPRSQPAPGHVVCLTWDSAVHKFGIDRGGGVWGDLGDPDRLRFWFDFGDIFGPIAQSWKGQRLHDGLPVIATVFEKAAVRYELEQFAYPLDGPPPQRRGDIPMVLLAKLTLTNLKDEPRPVAVRISHRREFPASDDLAVAARRQGDAFLFEQGASRRVLFCVAGRGIEVETKDLPPGKAKDGRVARTTQALVSLDLPAGASRELIAKLPSPVLAPGDGAKLLELDYAPARAGMLKFWSDYLARGAQFRVPEPGVNELFRAGLWHALRLPRRHGGRGDNVRIDLPYSNFAYGQHGTPWPVNQAVYVDYMIYDLRGYHGISAEELRAIYRNSQQPDGRVGGVANWVVYTPGMMYATAKHYLLSGDRKALEGLLPQTLKALDWCLAQIEQGGRPFGSAQGRLAGPSAGLVRGPLNDGTGDGVWAFSQAYVCAGLELLGRVLGEIGHGRAGQCQAAARTFRQAVERAFGAAAMRSPLVQLRDHTWCPYVPCEARTPGRLLRQWYPADVDTGAVHLLRLKALPADGALADCLLHDHEDNLYLGGWGMANEPVYNQQATAYLLRDDAKAAIRAFYSYMACAFSHSVYEPVEHRWTHGQYFGPPSTDGAWFELYRHMLIHELDADTLLLGQAAPRKWLQDGQRIEVQRAPTYYGRLSFTIESRAGSGQIQAAVTMPDRSRPKVLLVRLRHPQGSPIRSATVNGRKWSDFDARKEWVRIEAPDQPQYSVVVRY
jgi:hypothetical protein